MDAVAFIYVASQSSPLGLIAETPWWPANLSGGPASEFHRAALAALGRGRAWRRGRWREADDPDPDGVARAGLLCRLGCWAVAAVDPEWMARWWHDAEQARPAATRDRRPGHRSGRPRTPPGRALGVRAAGRRRRLAARLARMGASECGRRTQPAGLYPGSLPLGRTNPLVTRCGLRRRRGCRPSPGCESWSPRFRPAPPRRSSRPTRLSMKNG